MWVCGAVGVFICVHVCHKQHADHVLTCGL